MWGAPLYAFFQPMASLAEARHMLKILFLPGFRTNGRRLDYYALDCQTMAVSQTALR